MHRQRSPQSHASTNSWEELRFLEASWQSGDFNAEAALEVLFLSWYCVVEPPSCTGMPRQFEPAYLFQGALQYLGGPTTQNAEACALLAVMAEQYPWCMGVSEQEWVQLAPILKARALSLCPKALEPTRYSGRGSFGRYLEQMLGSSR